MILMYILGGPDGRTPVALDVTQPENVTLWAEFSKKIDGRRVALTMVDDIMVSTVFLGIDHNYTDTGPPITFETMVQHPTGAWDDICQRYRTWEEAAAGHAAVVKIIEARRELLGEKP